MNFPFTFKSNFLGGQLSSWSLLNVNRRNFHWNSPFCELLWTFRTWKLASNWEVEFKSEPLCDLNLASIISGLMPTNSVKLHFGHGFGSKLAQIGLPKNRIKMNFPDIFGLHFWLNFYIILKYDIKVTYTRVLANISWTELSEKNSTGALNLQENCETKLLSRATSVLLSSRIRRRSWQSRCCYLGCVDIHLRRMMSLIFTFFERDFKKLEIKDKIEKLKW